MPEYAHNFKNITSVGIGAFANATFSGAVNLSSVSSLPDATETEDRPAGADHDYGVFEGSNVEEVHLNSLTTIGKRSFTDSGLQKIYAPKCTIITPCSVSGDSNVPPRDPYIRRLDEKGPFEGVHRNSQGRTYGMLNENFKSLVNIGNGAFFGCYLDQNPRPTMDHQVPLREIGFSNKIKTIGHFAFAGPGYQNYAALGYNFELPEVEWIGDYAFKSTNMFLPGKIINGERILNLPECKYIGYSAFNSDYTTFTQLSFDKAYLPKIHTLAPQCFYNVGIYNNSARTEIHIGKDCTKIGYYFTTIPTSNMDIYFYGTTPPARTDLFWTESRDFRLIPDDQMPSHIYVPDNSVEAYKNGVLKFYKSVITPMSQAPNPQDW